MQITNEFLILVPLVIGLVEMVKRIGVSARYLPLVSVIFGVAGAYFFVAASLAAVLQGVAIGLTAVGLFSGVRTSIK